MVTQNVECTCVLVVEEESEPPPKNEKNESKKLTAWCGCSCSTAPMSRFFLGAALASKSSSERRTASSSLIAVSVTTKVFFVFSAGECSPVQQLTQKGQGTVPNWVPFRVPGSPRGPFCGFGSPLGLLFCPKVPFFSILGKERVKAFPLLSI